MVAPLRWDWTASAAARIAALPSPFAQRCHGCGARLSWADDAVWCALCSWAIEPQEGRGEPVAGVPVFAGWRYGGPVAEAIVAAKVRGGCGSDRLIAQAWANVGNIRKSSLAAEAAAVVAVPPQPDRCRERLGHLPDAIAAHLARRAPERTVVHALSRHDRGAVRRSAGLTPPKLQVDVCGDDRPVLLVDDVVTTGLTLRTAIRALRGAGWDVVGAFCLADARA